MCICNESETEHCRWHRRIMRLYDIASGMTESGLYDGREVYEALVDVEQSGELRDV